MINSKEKVGGIGKGGLEGNTSCGNSGIEMDDLDADM